MASGCDSLAATRFVCQVKHHFKVDLPVSTLYNSSMNCVIMNFNEFFIDFFFFLLFRKYFRHC